MAIRLLVGDIGGTNARLELWEAPASSSGSAPPPVGAFQLLAGKVYESADFKSLAGLVTRFLEDHGAMAARISGCCIAVCGPVADEDRMVGPVLPAQPPTQWNACSADLTTGALAGVIDRACLVNDFVAVGLGITAIDPRDVTVLRDAPRVPRSPIACVGAGTGLGEVFLTWQTDASHPDGGYYVAWPCEGGMTEFLAHNEEEWRLREFIRTHRTPDHVTVEGVVSGPGLANVYAYLQHTGQAAALESQPGKPLQVAVAEGALAGDAACLRALDMMLRAWAAECRQAALRTMCFGGLYLAGGLAAKLNGRIQEIVPAEFVNDQVMGDLLATVPLFSILNENIGLLGARVRAQRQLY